MLRGFARGIKPVPEMTVSEWADKYREIAGKMAARPGRWRTSTTPYLREIMDCMSVYSPVQDLIFIKGSQIGGTEAGNNIAMYYIDLAPCPMIMYFSKDDMASEHSKFKFMPSVRETPRLEGKIKSARSRDSDSTILIKDFPGGVLFLLGAQSENNFAHKTAKYIHMDEIARWPDDVGGEGDPVTLAENRANAFEYDHKFYKVSSPTIRGACKAEREWLNSDQRYYYVPCPYCGHMQRIEWANIVFKKTADYHRDGDAMLRCTNGETCGKLIPESKKTWMLATENGAEWRPTQKGRKKRGYHLSSLYTPNGWRTTWNLIVDKFLEAHREQDRHKLQVWTNTLLAEVWGEDMESMPEDVLIANRKEYPAEVPAGACVLILSVDIQKDRFEYLVKGWGVGNENWAIEYGSVPGDPTQPEFWESLDDVWKRKFQHELGLKMGISLACVDSAYLSEEVYKYVRPRQKHRMYAIRGATPHDAPLFKRPKNPDRGIYLYMIGTNYAKDWLLGSHGLYLRKDLDGRPITEGPNFCHYPVTFDIDYFAQVTAEHKKLRGGRYIWDKKKPGLRNEGLDLEVYNRAGVAILNPIMEVISKKIEAKAAALREGKPVPKFVKKRRKIYSKVER